MTGLRDLLKKKDKIEKESSVRAVAAVADAGRIEVPEFKFIRTTTESEEVIQPPVYAGDDQERGTSGNSSERSKDKKRHTLGFRKSSAASTKSSTDDAAQPGREEKHKSLPARPKADRRLSERFGLSHKDKSRSVSAESSTHLPEHLPEAPDAVPAPSRQGSKIAEEEQMVSQQRERQWEKRATMLAQSSPLLDGAQPHTPHEKPQRPKSSQPADTACDETIQEAIRLHETGDLEASTTMFGRLANPIGANNALAQVLYGLALRHGWGIRSEPEKAISYLALAASNSASISETSLSTSSSRPEVGKSGGAGKGELVLAIFELANCFRHGWGVNRDPMAARQYYETAANLGDEDALEEAAWCLLEGFGGGKDKVCILYYFPFLLCSILQ
ncbi:hypothetical protein LTR62_005125 [Meristemomyces frigidus]|uniref:Uncharacterized protein n=1 Tax=Meristemomyces frigidus TaxID=1508187 RepID=A0AAN7TWG8_9PEZI|nr:hypothetical protein LTR62_005125 [Meristemomyces frigidus]